MQVLPQCGTNLAATDGVLMVQALVATEAPPDQPVTASSQAAATAVVSRFLEAGGIAALLQVGELTVLILCKSDSLYKFLAFSLTSLLYVCVMLLCCFEPVWCCAAIHCIWALLEC